MLVKRRCAFVPCAPKRRRHDAASAARRIQRWLRARRVLVWDPWRAGMCACLWTPRLLHLVEPAGKSYLFSADALALLFISTADFRHPLTRRALSERELTRLERRASPRCALLLRHTRMRAAAAQRALLERDSLESFMQAQAAAHLDAALDFAEGPPSWRFYEALDAYDEAVDDLQRRFPGSCASTLQHHHELARRRRGAAAPAAWDDVDQLLQQLRARHGDVAEPRASPAYVTWLRASWD
jgi:hypothetical protein